MEYNKGTIGRVFVVRFDEGDDFLGGLEDLAISEKIYSGWFHVLGGLRNAGVVTGPQEPVMPPEPVWQEVSGAKEVMGTGSIFWEEDKPKIHLHAALGDHEDTLTACVRKNTKVFLVLEVYIIEVKDISATRPWYEKGGFNRLTFS